jgi:hypothetical protein
MLGSRFLGATLTQLFLHRRSGFPPGQDALRIVFLRSFEVLVPMPSNP